MGGATWIVSHGPVVACHLTPTEPEMDFMRIHAVEPTRVAARFMIDTGAAASAVSESLLRAVGARRVRRERFLTVHHQPFVAWVYRAAIEVLGDEPDRSLRRFHVDFAALPEPPENAPYEGVLGRDFLAGKYFAYDGVKGAFGLRLKDS